MNKNESIRTFIAIELPEEVKSSLRNLQNRLKSSNPGTAKWVEPGNIHLTLKFLGDTRLSLVPSITAAMDVIAGRNRSFALSVTELGAFPDIYRVQVVWVGLTGAISVMNTLQRDIESSIAPLGFPTEKRPFVPHLTLARMRETASPQDRHTLGALLSRTKLDASMNLTIGNICLIQSRLTPGGAVYSILHLSKLNQG